MKEHHQAVPQIWFSICMGGQKYTSCMVAKEVKCRRSFALLSNGARVNLIGPSIVLVQIQPKIWRVALHMFKTGQRSVPSHSGLYKIQYIFRTVYGTNLGSVWRQNGNMLMSKPFAVQPVAITGSHFGLQVITDFSIHITLMSIILPIAPPEEWKVHTLGTCYWLHREGKWMPIIILLMYNDHEWNHREEEPNK